MVKHLGYVKTKIVLITLILKAGDLGITIIAQTNVEIIVRL